ncbi:hypothetical protein FB446DRAFT_786106 [Lentinula raphanica]|nr:hypothetical protein FB446DRAFT_786106 [Lentinula raphanica]
MLSLTYPKSSSTSLRRILATLWLFSSLITIANAASVPQRDWLNTVVAPPAEAGSSSQSENSHDTIPAHPAKAAPSSHWLDTVLANEPEPSSQTGAWLKSVLHSPALAQAGTSPQSSKAGAPGTERAHTQVEALVNLAEPAGSSSQSQPGAPANEAHAQAEVPVAPAEAGSSSHRSQPEASGNQASGANEEVLNIILDVRSSYQKITNYVDLYIGKRLITLGAPPTGVNLDPTLPIDNDLVESTSQEYDEPGVGKKNIGSVTFTKGGSSEAINAAEVICGRYAKESEQVHLANQFLEELVKQRNVRMGTHTMGHWIVAMRTYLEGRDKQKENNRMHAAQSRDRKKQKLGASTPKQS